jgi:A1 cistron-splicing factor AAR2
VASLTNSLSTRFPSFIDDDNAQQVDRGESTGNEHTKMEDINEQMDDDVKMSDGESDSDNSGPVVVPSDEVQASFDRLSQQRGQHAPSNPTEYSKEEREAHPLLFAARMEHEDILMACARILDEANDVSLVREAAAYLEEVEAKR